MEERLSLILSIVFFLIGGGLFYFLYFQTCTIWQDECRDLTKGETSFIPLHLIFTIIVTGIFIGIIYLLYKIQRSLDLKYIEFRYDEEKLKISESLRNRITSRFNQEDEVEQDRKRLIDNYFKDLLGLKPNDSYNSIKIDERKRDILQTPEKNRPLPIIGLDVGASVGLATLFISLIVAFIASFIQTPILDYEKIIGPNVSKK